MSYTGEELIYAAEKLRLYLPRALQKKLDALLARAQDGERVDIQIVDLLSADAEASEWMRQALFGGPGQARHRRYDRPGGELGSILATSSWKCPKCDFSYSLSRAGRPVPPCPKHKCPLVPAGQEDKNNHPEK